MMIESTVPGFEKLVVGHRLRALVFRVHPGVQHDLRGLGFEQIGIRADTGVATETFEYHGKSKKLETRGPWGRSGNLSTHPVIEGIPPFLLNSAKFGIA